MTPSIAVSEALKAELEAVKERHDHLHSLNGVIKEGLEDPVAGNIPLEGYERTLTEPVRVSKATKELLRYIRDRGGYPDFEAVIRDRMGYLKRDIEREEPVNVRELTH